MPEARAYFKTRRGRSPLSPYLLHIAAAHLPSNAPAQLRTSVSARRPAPAQASAGACLGAHDDSASHRPDRRLALLRPAPSVASDGSVRADRRSLGADPGEDLRRYPIGGDRVLVAEETHRLALDEVVPDRFGRRREQPIAFARRRLRRSRRPPRPPASKAASAANVASTASPARPSAAAFSEAISSSSRKRSPEIRYSDPMSRVIAASPVDPQPLTA